MSEAHAFLAPSSASSWGPGGCPQFPAMAARYPEDQDSPEAREGTAAHFLLSETLLGNPVAVGMLAPNGHPITEEMADGIVDIVADFAMTGLTEYGVEERLYMPSIHPSLNWGTADIHGVDWRTKTVYVWDFKFGHGYVDEFECWQTINYGAGVVDKYNITDLSEWTFRLTIAQPRNFHRDGPLRPWVVDGARFAQLASQLAEAAQEAGMSDAPYKTGKQCGYCPGRHACPALQAVGGVVLDVAMQSTPLDMTPEAIGIYLGYLTAAEHRLEALKTGLMTQAQALIRRGQRVPGWAFEEMQGKTVWTQPYEDVVGLGDALGKDLRKPPAMITPKQAIKKGIDEVVISHYSTTLPGNVKLSKISDRAARKVFSK